MAFLIFGDIIAIWVFPVLLAGIGCALLYGYNFLLGTMGIELNPFILVIDYYVITALVWASSTRIGMQTPHLRDTWTALRGYLSQYLRIVLIIETVLIGIHFALSQAIRRVYAHPDATDIVAGLCVLIGSVVMNRWIVRSFLFVPTQESERELDRGHDLESGDDIAGRAWRDDDDDDEDEDD